MANTQKTPAQSLSDLSNRLKRAQIQVATQRAKLRDRCARLLFERCPHEFRRLVSEHATAEDWKRLQRLGIDDHLPAVGNIPGTTENPSLNPSQDPAQIPFSDPVHTYLLAVPPSSRFE